ncbi:MAG TPA: hypothetical protein VK595_07660 [Vicinamibacterales bacterium]|nr:hypothetical protein [Vicinamibacterales bacterium]
MSVNPRQSDWDNVPAYVAVDPSTLLGKEGHDKLVEIIGCLAGGLGYQGVVEWLAMWSDVDTALREARRLKGSVFT